MKALAFIIAAAAILFSFLWIPMVLFYWFRVSLGTCVVAGLSIMGALNVACLGGDGARLAEL
jgi:hypothetical protein